MTCSRGRKVGEVNKSRGMWCTWWWTSRSNPATASRGCSYHQRCQRDPLRRQGGRDSRANHWRMALNWRGGSSSRVGARARTASFSLTTAHRMVVRVQGDGPGTTKGAIGTTTRRGSRGARHLHGFVSARRQNPGITWEIGKISKNNFRSRWSGSRRRGLHRRATSGLNPSRMQGV